MSRTGSSGRPAAPTGEAKWASPCHPSQPIVAAVARLKRIWRVKERRAGDRASTCWAVKAPSSPAELWSARHSPAASCMHKRSRTDPLPNPLSTPFVEASIRVLLSVNQKCPKKHCQAELSAAPVWTSGGEKILKPGLDKLGFAYHLSDPPGDRRVRRRARRWLTRRRPRAYKPGPFVRGGWRVCEGFWTLAAFAVACGRGLLFDRVDR